MECMWLRGARKKEMFEESWSKISSSYPGYFGNKIGNFE
jgi:hypothetical protein